MLNDTHSSSRNESNFPVHTGRGGGIVPTELLKPETKIIEGDILIPVIFCLVLEAHILKDKA